MTSTKNEPSPNLELAPVQPGEKPMKTLAPFSVFEAQAKKLIADAEAIALLDPTPANARVARAMRLEVRPFRTSIEKEHERLKRPVLDEGRKLDDAKNALMEMLKPVEAKLLAIEQHAERAEAAARAALKAERDALLAPYVPGGLGLANVEFMSADTFAETLAGFKAAHEAKIAAEAKRVADEAEARRVQKLRAERALELAPLAHFITTRCADLAALGDDAFAALLKEGHDGKDADDAAREAQRVENDRLAKLAKKQADALAAQQAAAAADAARAAKIADDERKAAKALADAALAEAEAEAAKERKKAKDAADALAQQQAEAAKKIADAALAAEKAAAAPDKEKLLALAGKHKASTRADDWPEVSSPKASAILGEFESRIEEAAEWLTIESQKL